MPSVTDVQIQVINASYTENLSGQRNFKFNINYSIQNLSEVPLRTKVDVFVQFSKINGIVTELLKIPRTLFTENGTITISIFDSGSFLILPDATMKAEVFMWLRDEATAITSNVGTQQDLVVEQPSLPDPTPITSMISQVIQNVKLQNGLLTGVINATTTNTFDSFFFGKPQRHFLQIKNLLGSVIALIETSVTFTAQNQTKSIQFSKSGLSTESVVIESFLWDSKGSSFSQVINQQIDDSTPGPVEFANTSFSILFFDNTRQSFILDDAQFRLLEDQTTSPDWSIVNVVDSEAPINATFNQVFDAILTKLATKIDDSVANNMVIQTSSVFEIKDGRVIGDISYEATQNFNPFWFGKALTSIVQIVNENGQILAIKSNDLVFTDVSKTEQITIDEDAGSNKTVKVQFFVWVSQLDARAFSDVKEIEVTESVFGFSGDEFSQEFTAVDYRETPKGKSLFVQVQVTKEQEVPIDTVRSFLQVKRNDGTVINIFEKEVSVKGVNAFPIVYDIDDLLNPTVNITVEHFLSLIDAVVFVSDKIVVSRTIGQEPPSEPETVTHMDPFKVVMGLFASAVAGTLLFSKGGK